MLNIRILFIFVVVFLTFSVSSTEVSNCSENDVQFIQFKLKTGLLDPDVSLHERPKFRLSFICSMENEIMMDGLRLVLFKRQDVNEKYVEVLNGLDGSLRYYGPFVE